MKSNYNFWIKWLKITSLFVIVFGLFMALSSIIPNSGFTFFDNQINPSFFNSSDLISKPMKEFQSWQYGIGASMLVSWGILILFLSSYPLVKKEKWAWKATTTCLFSWFIVDQTISFFYNVWFNVIFNFLFLISFLIPLLAIRYEFRKNE